MTHNITTSAQRRVCLPLILAFGLGVTVISSRVAAQETSDSSVSDTQTSLSLSPAGLTLNVDTCTSIASDREFTLTGSYKNIATANYAIRLVATTGSSCSYEDACDQVPLDDGQCSCLKQVTGSLGGSVESISTTFTVDQLFNETCIDGEEQAINFFLHYIESEVSIGSLTPIEVTSPAVRLPIDLDPPAAPNEAPAIVPAEEALVITAPDVGGDVVRYEACVWPEGQGRADARCQDITVETGSRFEGLLNDTLYHVIYAVYDDADNRSEDSPEAEGTPASVLDFAEVYSGEYKGGERGGCQSSTRVIGLNLLFIFLSLFVSWLITRKIARKLRSRIDSFILLVSVTLAGSLTGSVTGECKPTQSGRSSRTSTVTLTGGAYQPNIDEEFLPREGVQRPYERVFKDQSPVMFQLQVERHLIQDRGLLSVGGILGYWSVEGEGLSVTTVTESTKMTIIPYSVYGAYRFDVFKDLIPLIPTLKLGMSYYSWTIYDGGGEVSSFVDGSEASGGTIGWFYSIGVNLLLDFLDREMAWAFDRDAGVNHSYLSFEYQSSQVNDFGDPDSFRLGSNTFFFGISLDL